MYPHVFVAGTFDSLHDGHELLLTRAFENGERVTIGLTSDIFVKTYKKDFARIKPFTDRKQELADWLRTKTFSPKAMIIAIDDPYEPAVSTPEVDVLIVTPDNKTRGEEINHRRKEKGLAPMALLLVPLVPAQDAKPISSTRVRSGEIDTKGRLILPDNLRPELVRPLGHVLVGDSIGSSIEKYRSGTIITVGDVTTKMLLTAGVVPQLAVVDFHVGRRPFPELDAKFTQLNIYRVQVKSGPGYIAERAIEEIKKWTTHAAEKTVMVVDGEEDLLTLPAVAYGPENAVVYYGQPAAAAWACGPMIQEGMVEVRITSEKKREADHLLAQFVTS